MKSKIQKHGDYHTSFDHVRISYDNCERLQFDYTWLESIWRKLDIIRKLDPSIDHMKNYNDRVVRIIGVVWDDGYEYLIPNALNSFAQYYANNCNEDRYTIVIGDSEFHNLVHALGASMQRQEFKNLDVNDIYKMRDDGEKRTNIINDAFEKSCFLTNYYIGCKSSYKLYCEKSLMEKLIKLQEIEEM